MLTAITHGKAGRVRLPESNRDVSWREVFREREDLLTAVLFGRFRYLSDAALGRVMSALVGEASAEELGQWQDIDFWPRLEGADDRRWVEPDVLLRFENALVMVEVKPPFGGDQSAAQWQAQLSALRAEVSGSETVGKSVVHFVALGRTSRVPVDALGDFNADNVFKLQVRRVEWDALAQHLPGWIAASDRTDAAVFADWNEAFALFGVRVVRPPRWEMFFTWLESHPVSPASRVPLRAPLVTESAPVSMSASNSRSLNWKRLADFAHTHCLELSPWN